MRKVLGASGVCRLAASSVNTHGDTGRDSLYTRPLHRDRRIATATIKDRPERPRDALAIIGSHREYLVLASLGEYHCREIVRLSLQEKLAREKRDRSSFAKQRPVAHQRR